MHKAAAEIKPVLALHGENAYTWVSVFFVFAIARSK